MVRRGVIGVLLVTLAALHRFCTVSRRVEGRYRREAQKEVGRGRVSVGRGKWRRGVTGTWIHRRAGDKASGGRHIGRLEEEEQESRSDWDLEQGKARDKRWEGGRRRDERPGLLTESGGRLVPFSMKEGRGVESSNKTYAARTARTRQRYRGLTSSYARPDE
jgi:hypothetical protein